MPDVGVNDRRLAEAQILAREYTPAEIDAKAPNATELGTELSRRQLLREATIETDEQLDRAVLTGS